MYSYLTSYSGASAKMYFIAWMPAFDAVYYIVYYVRNSPVVSLSLSGVSAVYTGIY
jgi:hypothetical protein